MNDLQVNSESTAPRAARPVTARPVAREASPRPGPIMRFWLGLPDWVFRAAGALFFLAYLYGYAGVAQYRNWPNIGPFYRPVAFVDAQGISHYGDPHYFPWTKVLIDITFVQVIFAFIFRRRPRQRADRPSLIVIPLITAIWPLLPFLLLALVKWLAFVKLVSVQAQVPIGSSIEAGEMGAGRFWSGVSLMCLGNCIDVWGYTTLFRSLSIVAEARVLKSTGPYRWIRHPIYLGQFISQAGFYLFLVQPQLKWFIFYGIFVAMQLYRSKVEEEVLLENFGVKYRELQRRTWWFFTVKRAGLQ